MKVTKEGISIYEFADTGLDANPMTYSALMVHNNNIGKTFGPEFDTVRLAMSMNENGIKDPTALSLAMLRGMPEQTYDTIRSNPLLGDNMVSLIKELNAQEGPDYTALATASQPVKQVYAAMALKDLAGFTAAVTKQMEEREDKETPEGEMHIAISFLPNLELFEKIQAQTAGGTGNAALDQKLLDKVNEIRETNEEAREKMRAYGMVAPAMGVYPDFDSLGLMDDKLVRDAYEYVANNKEVPGELLMSGVAVAKVLSDLPEEPNPLAVALALTAIPLPMALPEDFDTIAKKVSSDVSDIMSAYPLIGGLNEKTLKDAPPAFKQVASVFLASTLEGAVEVSKALIAQAEGESELAKSPKFKLVMKKQLAQAQKLEKAVREEVAPFLLGKTGSKELDDHFSEKLQALSEFVKENAPDAAVGPEAKAKAAPAVAAPATPAAPAAPRKPGPGDGSGSFDL